LRTLPPGRGPRAAFIRYVFNVMRVDLSEAPDIEDLDEEIEEDSDNDEE
jgi:hypothetical protein